jgi:hypothetical protein
MNQTMNQILLLFAASLAVATALAAVAIWSPRALWVKVGALAITASFVPLTYVSLVELLSRPKPVALEWSRAGLAEAKVLGADLREGQSIYLWVRVPGVDEPRSYLLPWDQRLAQQLHKAQREANERGTDVRAKNLFKRGPKDDHPVFYARPQEARPPKSALDYQPYVFQSGPNARGGG